jgi:hypothetical protein
MKGADSAGAGATIVVEAKASGAYTLKSNRCAPSVDFADPRPSVRRR